VVPANAPADGTVGLTLPVVSLHSATGIRADERAPLSHDRRANRWRVAAACAVALLVAGTAVNASATVRDTPTIHQRRAVPMVSITHPKRPAHPRRHLSRKQRNELIAVPMVAKRGWSHREFKCLDQLWARESSWNEQAFNPWSGAYGIPQALPGEKMRSAGNSWRTDPKVQIKWGLGYIGGRYGSPCGAWNHSLSTGWY
jgi:hypothetical protein